MAAEVRLAVRLTPRGGRDGIDGVVDGALAVRVAAPPVDGAANEALLRLLARELDIPYSAVRLVSGASGRRKIVGIRAAGAAQAASGRWPGVAVG